MKKIFLFFCVLFLINAAQSFAQNEEVFNYPLNAQTKETFRTVCANIAQHQIIKGNFEQEKIIARLNRSLKSAGNFIISSKQGMIWDTVNPFPSMLVLGSDFMIQIRPGGQKTVLNTQGNETFLAMSQVLSGVFSGNAGSLENNFKIFFTGNASSWVMALIPLDKTISLFAQRIIMNGDTVIKTIQMNEQNGDTIIYVLANHKFPAVLDDIERAYFIP